MKGLLKKDAYVLLRQLRVFLAVLVFFAFVPNGAMLPYAIAYAAMIPYTAMAYDERSKWVELAAMMPYTPGDIVLSKYLLGWLAVGGMSLLSLAAQALVGIISGSVDSLQLVLPACCLGLLSIAITQPLMFRFGVEKARFGIMLLIIVAACGSAAVLQEVYSAGIALPAITVWVNLGLPAAVVVLTPISLWLSMRFYRRKLA